MKILSERKGLLGLRRLKDDLRRQVSAYEQNAKSCATCETPGACCLDEHFVNVKISRLEARAIRNVLAELAPLRQAAVAERIRNTAEDLASSASATEAATFACPLYERGTGCLVHDNAKPVPCIVHACYERKDDLPPDALQNAAELAIDRLDHCTYGKPTPLSPLPIALADLG